MAVRPSVLRSFPALARLEDSELLKMAQALEQTQFRAGAQICREGDMGEACYFLVEGRAEVTKALPDGRKIFLAELSAGDVFGQGALVEHQARTADVRAVGNVNVLALRPIRHRWALKEGEHWAVVLEKLVCINVIRQLRSALERLAELASSEHPELFVDGVKPPAATPRAEGEQLPAQGSEGTVLSQLEAPRLEQHDVDTTGRLLTLLAETEAELGQEGLDLNQVQFVNDDDSRRRAQGKGPGRG
ncbi:MAG: cyclic nucleotide-binding domain-containing protein [Myxococcota bacterium]|nr:cyclic nucleotide-binding domain-containing protein [Myxococcota bacterium]